MTVLLAIVALFLIACGFLLAVAVGAANGTDELSLVSPLPAYGLSMLILTAQAVLWVWLGLRIAGGV